MTDNPNNRHLEIQVTKALLDRAYEKAVKIFSDWELTPPDAPSRLSIEIQAGKLVLDMKRDVVPPLAFALHYFGDTLPVTLISKLRNKPQTTDTLFELLCLGFFASRHKVIYEPTLGDGKVPDLLIESKEVPPIYVECKSHRLVDAPYLQAFTKISSEICEAFSGQPITDEGKQEHLRLEVYLKGRPDSSEMEELKKALPALRASSFRTESSITSHIAVIAVPLSQPLRSGGSMWCGRQDVGTESTRVGLEDSTLLAYSWPGLSAAQKGPACPS